MEPQKFAAELIHRLEAIQRTREAEEKLEERLKRVRMVSWAHVRVAPGWFGRGQIEFGAVSGPRSSLQGLPDQPLPV